MKLHTCSPIFALMLLGCPDDEPQTAPLTPWGKPLGAPSVQLTKNANRDVDCNGDGYADLISINTREAGSRQLAFVPGGPTGLRFDAMTLSELPGRDASLLALAHLGDVNGDGFSDFAVSDERANATTDAHIYLCSAAGLPERASAILTELSPRPTPPPELGGTGARPAGDLNGDGIADLIVERYSLNAGIYYGSRSGLRTTPDIEFSVHPTLGALHGVLPVGDLDADGYADLLLVWRSSFQEVAVTLHRGSPTGPALPGTAQATDIIFNRYLTRTAHKALDFDGDGMVDIVGFPHPDFPHADLLRSTGFWFRGDTIGYFGTYRNLLRWAAGEPEAPGAGVGLEEHVGVDIDGDGIIDILGYETSTDEASRKVSVKIRGFKGGARRSDEEESLLSWDLGADYTFTTSVEPGARQRLTCPGDIDGDGFQDCLLLSNGRTFGVRGSPDGPRLVTRLEQLFNPGQRLPSRATLVDPLYR